MATWGFATGAFMWIVARAVILFDWSQRASDYVESLYVWTVDAAFIVAAALCAWRPLPGTRSHVFARVAVVGWLVAVVAGWWPSHTITHYDECGLVRDVVRDPPGLLAVSSIGRLLLVLSLAGSVLASGRRFALPRWTPVIAAGLGATLTNVGFDELLSRAAFSPAHLPTYTLALTELVMLIAFTAAFTTAAFALRRRPFLDEEAVLSTPAPGTPNASDARAFAYWRASISAVLAFTFAFASLAGEALGFVPSLAGWGSSRSIVFALGLVVFLVLVERARRRHAEASSFALTIGSGVAALFGAASVYATLGARPLILREMSLVTTAFTLGGIALLLPNIPAVGREVAKVKGALYLGALFLALSAGAKLSAASRSSAPERTEPWINGETILLLAAFFFVTLAVHLTRPIEREALIAEALASEQSEHAGDDDY